MRLPRENYYTCMECGHWFGTVDVDEGVTPFMLKCRKLGCNSFASSAMYPKTLRPSNLPAPMLEFYAPSQAQRKGLSEGELAHVENGGLLLRCRTDAEPVYHDAADNAQRAPRVEPSFQAATAGPKIGRNDSCPCGSFRKFKRCCGGVK